MCTYIYWATWDLPVLLKSVLDNDLTLVVVSYKISVFEGKKRERIQSRLLRHVIVCIEARGKFKRCMSSNPI